MSGWSCARIVALHTELLINCVEGSNATGSVSEACRASPMTCLLFLLITLVLSHSTSQGGTKPKLSEDVDLPLLASDQYCDGFS